MKRVAIAAVVLGCLFWAQPAHAVPTFVAQQRVAVGSAGSKTSGALSTTTTDLIVAWCLWGDSTKTVTVSDSGLHTWTSKTKVSNGVPNAAQLWYTYGSAITGAGPTVTCTLSSGTALINLEVMQFAGTDTGSDPFDVEDTNTVSAGTAMTSNAFSTSVSDEVVTHFGFQSSSGSCSTVGLIAGTNGTIGGTGCTGEYRIVSATLSSVTANIVNGSAPGGVTSTATFKSTGGSGGGGTSSMGGLTMLGVGMAVLIGVWTPIGFAMHDHLTRNTLEMQAQARAELELLRADLDHEFRAVLAKRYGRH